MKSVVAGVLDVAYEEVGPTDGSPVILMHGFPYDIHTYDVVAEHLSSAGKRCIIPYLRGYGPTRFRDVHTLRSGQQAALGADLLALMDALSIPDAVLAGYDWGGRAACIVSALWPQCVRGLVSCGGYNIQDIPNAGMPLEPAQEHRSWYMYYFNTERGRAGLTQNRYELCRLIWQLFSPTWKFDEATYARTAAAFENPDFVDIVIHSYRHRISNAVGDPALESIEERLAAQPTIPVPTIILEGKDNGVNPPKDAEIEKFSSHFTGSFHYRLLAGIGHNTPQEAPNAFAEAILSLG